MKKLLSAAGYSASDVVAETARTHSPTADDADAAGFKVSSLIDASATCCDRDISSSSSGGGMPLLALSMWQRLVQGVESCVGLQSPARQSYSLIN